MTSDDTLPMPVPGYVHPALASALAARGYDTMTPVQRLVLDESHAAADLLVSAQTGSGKTVAFGLAVAPTLLGEAGRFEAAAQPLGLVIAPTRELAMQVQRELDWLYAEAQVQTASAVGGMDIRAERRALERGAHIVVGTPGRLRDHITKGALDLSQVRVVVLDEADEMLDLGFREDLEFILAAAPAERRTLMFSATVPRAIAQLAQTFQRDAVRLTATAASERHADIEYQLMPVQAAERENAIINTLLYFDGSKALVFCHTREAVKHLTARLANRGFAVVALSGELTQAERTNALQAMRDGRARVCVATDVAARGIDLPNLDLVIHADLPGNPDTLLHRSGRTGRAGRKGVCVLVVPLHRRNAALRVLKLANLEAQVRPAPTIAEIDARYRQQILDAALETAPPDASEAAFVNELLGLLTPEQLAAAYLRTQLAARPVPEEVSDAPLPKFTERAPKRRFEDEAPFERGEMAGGVWFSLSVGRKQRADPKWLLPMLCKAGGLTRRDIGTIRIGDSETRFEVAGPKAEAFAAQIARTGSGEKGITIRLADGGAPAYRPEKVKYRDKEAGAPRYKVRTDKGEKLPAEPVAFPGRKPKDKGKPKRRKPPAA